MTTTTPAVTNRTATKMSARTLENVIPRLPLHLRGLHPCPVPTRVTPVPLARAKSLRDRGVPATPGPRLYLPWCRLGHIGNILWRRSVQDTRGKVRYAADGRGSWAISPGKRTKTPGCAQERVRSVRTGRKLWNGPSLSSWECDNGWRPTTTRHGV